MQRYRNADFVWDNLKARRNLQKHGISFHRATSAFLDRRAVSIYDEQHSIDEDRWVLLGLDHTGNLLVVIHTFEVELNEEVRVRIISARKATLTEAKHYGLG